MVAGTRCRAAAAAATATAAGLLELVVTQRAELTVRAAEIFVLANRT